MNNSVAKIFVSLCALFALTLVVLQILNAPLFDWNGRRLVGSVATAYGYNVYTPERDWAAISGLNGPLFVFAYLPASLATSPDTATQIGSFIAALLVFGSVLLFLLRSSSSNSWEKFSLFILFVLLTFYSKALSLSAFMVHADAPALTLCALSCCFAWWALESQRRLPLILSAFCGAAAFYSKITFLPICAAIPTYIFLRRGSKEGLIAGSYFVGAFAILSALFISLYTFESLRFGIFPGQNNFAAQLGDTANFASSRLDHIKTFFSAFVELLWEYFPLLLFVMVYAQSSKKFINAPFFLPFVIAIFMVPAAIAGRSHSGGAANTQSPAAFFLILSFVFALDHWLSKEKRNSIASSLVLLLLFTLGTLHIRTAYSLTWPLKGLSETPQRMAFEAAKKYGNEIYFPDFPLSSLLAEKKLYHSGRALAEYEYSPIKVSDDTLRKYLPPNLKYVAFIGEPYGEVVRRIPGFDKKISLPELPKWTVLAKSDTATN